MKRLSTLLLILAFGLVFAPSASLMVSPGLVYAQQGEPEPAGPEEIDLGAQININTASAEELAALEGIGGALAQNIVEYRDANGPFATIEDIKKVKGVGSGKFEKIKDRITVEEP